MMGSPPIPNTNAEWEAHWKAVGVWKEPPTPQQMIVEKPAKPPNALRRVAARLSVDTAAVALSVALVEAEQNPYTTEVLRQRLAFAIAEWSRADPSCPTLTGAPR